MKKKKSEKYNIEDEEIYKDTENKESSDALSDEELAWLKSSIDSAEVDRSKLPHYDNSDRATFWRFIKSRPVLAVASLIVALAIVLSAIGGTAFIAVKIMSHPWTFNIVIADDTPYEVSYKDAVIDGVLYVDMLKIAEVTELVIGGSYSKPQFASIKTGTYVAFENGSSRAYINGGFTEIVADTFSDGKSISAKVYANEEQCLVPYTFLKAVISEECFILQFREEENTIYIKPKYNVYNGDLENRVMKELLFVTDNFDIILPPRPKPNYTYSYKIDVSGYLESITAEHLMLANKHKDIGKYEPSNLKKLTCATTRELYLDYDAAVALEAMMLEMEEAGITETFVTSAYRSYDYQKRLYDGYVQKELERDGSITREEAERRASVYSARPGESEHQTGLCLDFITADMGGNLNEEFENKEAFEWLSKNAYKYGFILRYPEDKVDITGYQYEPWHYRFVGRQAASDIYFSGISLEEYLAGQR